MPCTACIDVVERTDIPHVVRICSCGRELHIAEPGDHGRGIKVQKGDRFVFPAGWITLSLNPLKSRGCLSRAGIGMLAGDLLLDGITNQMATVWEHLAAVEARVDGIVNAFEPLKGLDVNREEDIETIVQILSKHTDTREFFAFWTGHFLASARDAKEKGNLDAAVWSVSCAERLLAMVKFKEALEDVVWMGHSVSRLRDVLAVWDGSRDNADEEFWQATFKENSFVLSQVFAEPLVFIQEKAYVGGMQLDRTNARFVDYLFSIESSNEAVLVEIKTPATPLLGGEYRGNRQPSRDLVGSTMQIKKYGLELVQNLRSIVAEPRLEAFSPKLVLVIGNGERELLEACDRRAFDLYRSTLRDVQIITFDELFRKVEILAELFRVSRSTTASSG